ncbi:MAG TPA: hypothetical protein VFB72_11070 [Verrucomicrobiae bacterium]|nr:hypothetical protein [Verrucomicrobiae bacterium]
MSHIVSIKTQVTDIEAVKAACKELGFTFNEGAKDYQAWGTLRPACAHSINVNRKGYKWEIGLIKNDAGYQLSYDRFLELEMVKGEGAPLAKGGSNFIQHYAVHKATIEARKRGYMVNRVAGKNGAIQLVVTGIK